VGPRAGLDDVEKRKFLILPRLELDLLGVQPVSSQYIDCAISDPVRRSSLTMRTLSHIRESPIRISSDFVLT
jgi:hypothetical protein